MQVEINQDIVQKYLNKFRKSYYAFEDSCYQVGYKIAYSNQFGFPSISANSWKSLLRRMIDWHDSKEIDWLKQNNIEIEF